MTRSIERHIDVDVPAGIAYERWWRSSESGEIAPDVEEVEKTGPQQYRWRAEIAQLGEEWVAEVTERIPGRRIAWRSRAGAPNAGCVTFHRLDDEHCRVMLQLEYEPRGLVERVGAALGFVRRSVDAALEDFKIRAETPEDLAMPRSGATPRTNAVPSDGYA